MLKPWLFLKTLKQITALLAFLLLCNTLFAQRPVFSLSTDFSVQRSLKKDQRYWALGQTVSGVFHFSSRNAAYASICYYTDGRFTNQLDATAKSPVTLPQQVPYTNNARLGIKQFSLGWKHYLFGASDIEAGFSGYSLVGLGLMFGKVANSQSASIDTALYSLPVLPGTANFKRLTYDLGLGIEKPIGGSVYGYIEGKILIPSTDYPSDHLLVNQDAPLTVYFNIGLRILFD